MSYRSRRTARFPQRIAAPVLAVAATDIAVALVFAVATTGSAFEVPAPVVAVPAFAN